MIPIMWDGAKWIKASNLNDPYEQNWYDYQNKKWANVALVSEATRNTYKTAQPGTTITEADVMAYLVWIPRYRYKLFNVNAEPKPEQEIEIEFEDRNTSKSNGSTNGSWLTHPAFTFGSEELNGVWVGKFETTGNATTPTVKPGEASLRSQNVSTQFATAEKFNTQAIYGLPSTLDAHMMKNMEWGAATYLSRSKYGKNNEISINANSSFYTGGGSSNSYISNTGQSTTGNIYGIYDMSGGAWEYVMGGMYNSGNTTIMLSSSGFNQATIDGPNMEKYIDKYTNGTTYNNQVAFDRRKLGDATGETRGWYGDYADFVFSSYPWFYRGYCYDGTDAGAFLFGSRYGDSGSNGGFRLAVSGVFPSA